MVFNGNGRSSVIIHGGGGGGGLGVLMILRGDKGISQYLSRGGLRVFFARAYGY